MNWWLQLVVAVVTALLAVVLGWTAYCSRDEDTLIIPTLFFVFISAVLAATSLGGFLALAFMK
jgi:membrane protein implicated in regulation of membrane protease activity